MNKKLQIVVYFLVMLYPLGLDLYLVASPEISDFLCANEKESGRIFSIYLIGVAISLIMSGKCLDIYGSKYVCVLGCLVYFLASLYCAGISEGELIKFLFARFFQGFGSGACYITALFLIRKNNLTRDLRIKSYSRLNGVSCTVPVVAPTLGALLVLKGWPLIFLFTSFLAGVLSTLSYCLIRNEEIYSPLEGERKMKGNYFSVNFITMAILSSISLSCVFSYVSSSPIILIDKLNMQVGIYGVWMGGIALLSVCTSILLPQLRKIFPDIVLLRLSSCFMFITGVSSICLNNYESLTKYLIVFSVISMVNAVVFSISLGYALEPFGDKSGEATGVLHTVQLIFTGFCLLLTSWIGVYEGEILVYFLALGGLISFMIIKYHQLAYNKQR